MTRRAVLAFRLLLVAGLLAAPASSLVSSQGVGRTAESSSAEKISISAVVPALTPARTSPVGKWLGGGRRDHQRIYTVRIWALVAAGVPLAVLLAFGILGLARVGRARLLIAARAISSRAPPASAFA